MISETHRTAYLAHCEAILAVLHAAHVPTFPPPDATFPQHTGVAILPALRVLKVNRPGIARFRQSLATEEYHANRWYDCNDRGEAFLVFPLGLLLPMLHFSRHPVGMQFAYWESTVDAALMAHGWYAPGTNHTPPPGTELDAIEIQSGMREYYHAVWGRTWEETWGSRQDETVAESSGRD